MGSQDDFEAAVGAPTKRSESPSRVVRWRLWDSLLVAVIAAVAAIVALPLTSATSARVGPGVVSASISVTTESRTVLALPPLGSLTADTHRAPTAVTLRLDEIDVSELQSLAASADLLDQDQVTDRVASDLPGLFRKLAVRLTLLSALIGVVPALVLPGRFSSRSDTVRRIVVGMAAAPVVALAVAGASAIDYSAQRFDSARFSGPLSMAEPLLQQAGGSISQGLDQLDERSRVLSQKIADLYSATLSAEVDASSGDTIILHVSDIHLNPVGVSLARELANTFDVDAVIDTGDLTSFGQEPEAQLVSELSKFDVPYYFVAGNHDGAGARRAVAQIPGVTAIDGEVVTVDEVRILGIDDPTETALRTIDRDTLRTQYEAQYPRTERLIDELEPDLLAVHNPVQINPAIGKVPTAIAGHLHRFQLSQTDGTVISVVGSSGATGLGALMVEATEEYAFKLLRYDGSELVAIDSISLKGTRGEFVSQRQVIRDDVTLDDDEGVLEDIVTEPALDDPAVEARRDPERDDEGEEPDPDADPDPDPGGGSVPDPTPDSEPGQ